MERIIENRGTGKTHKLMVKALKEGCSIACANPTAMTQKAYAYGITGINFIPYSDLFNGNVEPDDKVMIDEIEVCMREYMDGMLMGYTLTAED